MVDEAVSVLHTAYDTAVPICYPVILVVAFLLPGKVV